MLGFTMNFQQMRHKNRWPMFERIILFTFVTSLLFSDLAHAMEPEERESLPSQQRCLPEGSYLSKKEKTLPERDEVSIKTRYWKNNGKRTESKSHALDLFYEKCANQLVVYVEFSQKVDPNCGLPEKVAQPFLELCRQFTKGLRKKEDKILLIKVAASLNEQEVKFLTEKQEGLNNQYLSMWHCLVSETTPAKIRKKIIPLLLQIQEPKIEVLLRLNALLQEGDMNSDQLVELIKFTINLPEEGHFCTQENYKRVFKKHPLMSVEGKMQFLRQLSDVQAEGLEELLKAGEEGAFNKAVVFDDDKFVWMN